MCGHWWNYSDGRPVGERLPGVPARAAQVSAKLAKVAKMANMANMERPGERAVFGAERGLAEAT